MKKRKKIIPKELRSEEYQEVLDNIPPWILRWGIITIAVVMVILLLGCVIFKYPDTVQATVKLTGTTPAATIISKSTGKIQHLFVKDKQFVKADSYLALIENSANLNDVIYLKQLLSIELPWNDSIPKLPRKEINLGDFQSLYSTYYTVLAEYIQFKTVDYYKEKILLTQKRIEQNAQFYTDLCRQKQLVEKQLEIYYKQFRRDSLLYSKKLLSDLDLENTRNQYIQGQLSYESMYTNLESQQIQLEQMKESLFDTQYQYVDKKNSLELQLKSLTMQLQNEIKKWEMIYILKAPIAGKITFTNYWIENQNIAGGDKAFSIVPEKYGILIGKALLPVSRSGKVKPGQRVNIHFSNYPDNEFGSVNGIVRSISLVSTKVDNESNYIVEMLLPNGLLTTYKKVLPFMPDMEGQADIITDDQTVLERFFLPLKQIISESL